MKKQQTAEESIINELRSNSWAQVCDHKIEKRMVELDFVESIFKSYRKEVIEDCIKIIRSDYPKAPTDKQHIAQIIGVKHAVKRILELLKSLK